MVEQAKTTLAGFQSKDGPVEGMAAGLKQTMDDARKAMSAFAENMEALKHNFLRARLLQGPRLLQPRGDLAGGLPAGRADEGRPDRRSSRVWLDAAALFEPAPDASGRPSG